MGISESTIEASQQSWVLALVDNVARESEMDKTLLACAVVSDPW
jgi:hypothetical protein